MGNDGHGNSERSQGFVRVEQTLVVHWAQRLISIADNVDAHEDATSSKPNQATGDVAAPDLNHPITGGQVG